nr:interleukin 8 [Atractosteus tropicus]
MNTQTCALTQATRFSLFQSIMSGKLSVSVLIMCLALATLLEAKSVPTELRCQCIGKKESRFIHPKRIENLELFPSGPHCKNAEIIATLKTGKRICVEPTAPWVKVVIKGIMKK